MSVISGNFVLEEVKCSVVHEYLLIAGDLLRRIY